MRILSCLVRSLGSAPLKDDDVSNTCVGGGACSVLSSCVTAVCVLHARVCGLSVAAEMIGLHLPHQTTLSKLLARVQETLSDVAKVTCLNVALACGNGTAYRGIVESAQEMLHLAQLPAHICKCFELAHLNPIWCSFFVDLSCSNDCTDESVVGIASSPLG